MTKWSYDNQTKTGTLVLSGEMTIQHVSDLQTSLVEAFDGAEQVTIDVSATTAVDVAGLQLLCACHRMSISHGQKMCLRIGGNGGFAKFLEEVGFPLNFICDHGEKDKCEWPSVS